MKFGPHSFEASNLDKVLFPGDGITKGDLIDYYVKVAEYMLPHVQDRPLAMHRFPDGIDGKDFFQKNVPDYFPGWIVTASVKREDGSKIDMVLANNTATLAYLANQACIAPHIWLSRADKIDRPDKMIFDLDPPQGHFDLVIKAARALREVLASEHDLDAYAMTTGSKGMHVVVPLRRTRPFDEVRQAARGICEELAEAYPDDFTTEVRKDKRRGRLFLDYLRNSYGQHSIAPYGVRALPGAPVATPLDWDELGSLDKDAQTYTLRNIFRRLGQKGAVWEKTAK